MLDTKPLSCFSWLLSGTPSEFVSELPGIPSGDSNQKRKVDIKQQKMLQECAQHNSATHVLVLTTEVQHPVFYLTNLYLKQRPNTTRRSEKQQ